MSGRGGASLAVEAACVKVLRLRKAHHCQGTEKNCQIASVAGAEWAERGEAGVKFGEKRQGYIIVVLILLYVQ